MGLDGEDGHGCSDALYIEVYGQHFQHSIDHRVWLPMLAEHGNEFPLCPFVLDNLVSGDGSTVPSHVSPLILHTQTEPGAYLRAPSNRFP